MISGIVNKLMSSCLENRYHRTSMKDSKFNEVSSTWEHVKHGAPQNMVFGPLLFLIYINGFSSIISKKS